MRRAISLVAGSPGRAAATALAMVVGAAVLRGEGLGLLEALVSLADVALQAALLTLALLAIAVLGA